MNQIPNIEEEYTSHEALKEWENEKDQNNLTQNIVALLGIHGMHCQFYQYQNASHITKAFEDLFHHQLQKAREEERERIIKLIDWRGKGFNSGSEVVAWIDEQLKTLKHSELDQDTVTTIAKEQLKENLDLIKRVGNG